MLLIDAYNVLHVTGVLPPDLAGMDAPDLARAVARSRWARGGAAIKVVCDGPKPRGHGEPEVRGVEIVHAGPGKDADSLIEGLLERHSAPRGLTVVSSDRRLKAAARRRKAGWLSSEAFLRGLVADLAKAPRVTAVRPEIPLSKPAVEHWAEAFGLTGGHPFTSLTSAERAGRPPEGPGSEAAAFEVDLRSALEDYGKPAPADDLDMARWLSEDHPEFRRRLAEAQRRSRSRRGR